MNQEEKCDGQENRHELRKELKLLKLANMKMRKQLRLSMRVRFLNRTRLEGEITKINCHLSKLREKVLQNKDEIVDDKTSFSNPESLKDGAVNDQNTSIYVAKPTIQEDYKFYCDQCEFKCKKRTPFIIHLRRHTGERPYVCSHCGRGFVAKHELKLHSAKHDDQPQYECDQCSYTTYRPDMLVNHREKHSNLKTHQCDICDFKTNERCKMLVHRKTHSELKSSECLQCKQEKGRNRNVESNTQDVMKSTENKKTDNAIDDNGNPEGKHTCGKIWACDICGNMFKTRESLLKHARIHSGQRPFKCDCCDYSAATKHTLIVHQRKHSGEKPYACHLCDFRCTTKGYLKIHINKHLGIKPFKCQLCDYSSIDSCKLSVHLKVKHSDAKPFACSECPQRFKIASRLRLHSATHKSGAFVCNHCAKQFNNKRSLIEHEGKHTGDQPFKCTLCSVHKSFTLQSSLTRHACQHVWKLSCDQCHYKTASRKDMNRHTQACHRPKTCLLEKRKKSKNKKQQIEESIIHEESPSINDTGNQDSKNSLDCEATQMNPTIMMEQVHSVGLVNPTLIPMANPTILIQNPVLPTIPISVASIQSVLTTQNIPYLYFWGNQ